MKFTKRAFHYEVNAAWKTITADAQEEDDLRNSYDNPDCVEVFFVEHWDPEGAHGGGATWSSGTASAKIITSDENDNGIDLHHLAHELGHAVGLKHPGSGCPDPVDCPTLYDGSSGTVLCGSGYENDNPDVQSQENGDNANNPLMTFPTLDLCENPDCADSTNCGPC